MARKRKKADEDELATEAAAGADVDEADVDDDEDAPPLGAFLDPAWKPPTPKSPGERKVTNKYIPLFPDATKDPKRHAAAIKIYKSSPPGDGYKGTVDSPETVDESFIASLYGNGIFKLELLDQAKNVLRVRDNVKVDVPMPSGGANGHSTNGHGATDIEGIVAKLTAQSEAAIAKVLEATEKRLEREEKRLEADRAGERERSKEHTGMVTTLVKSEAEQLRAHYAAQQAAADRSAQTQIAMMAQAHAQTMQMMMAMQQAQASRSDPLLFLKVFQQGMQSAPSEDSASKVTGDIVKGLEQLRGLADTAEGAKKLTAGAPPKTAALAKTNGAAAAPATTKGAALEVSKEELKELVLLKRTFKARGMDKHLLDLMRQAREHYADPNTPIEEEVDEDDDGEQDEAPPKTQTRKKKVDDDGDAETAEKPADEVDGTQSPDA